MKLRVARKVLQRLLERSLDRLASGRPYFPAAAWNWRGGYRSRTIEEATNVMLLRLLRRR